MPLEPNQFRLSVVVPLDEHRGVAIAGVGSWLEQDVEALSRCELIVVANGEEPDIEREVHAMLRPQDRLLTTGVGNLFTSYNAAAEASRAPTLLFTESHVVATPGCLAAVLRELQQNDPATAVLASGGLYEGRFPETIDTLFDRELPRRLAQGWDMMVVRGTVVKKSLWRSLGGFQSRYGHYASLLFGAAMWRAGVRTRLIEDARVLHGNESSFAELSEPLLEFGRMDVRYRAENPHCPLLERLPACPNWDRRAKYSRRGAAEAIRSALGDTLRAIGRGKPAAALEQAGKALSAAPHWLLGPRWALAKALAHYHGALVRLRLLAWSPTLYRRAFRDAWGGLIRYGRLLETADQLRKVEPMRAKLCPGQDKANCPARSAA